LKQLRAEGQIKSRPAAEPEADDEADLSPPIPTRLLWIQQAFCALSRCRTVNEVGPQPITYADVAAYCAIAGIRDEDSRRDLQYFLTELDIRYLKITFENIKKARETADRKAKQEAERNKVRRRR
jgi:hypothetical protein